MEHVLHNYVKVVTTGRDSSHGYEHMVQVAENAKYIANCEGIGSMSYDLIVLVAMLHDVADHKYDKNGELMKNVELFVYHYVPKTFYGCVVSNEELGDICKNVVDCIDTISFSKEKKIGMGYYENLMDSWFVNIRNVVSDADKLEALGTVGILRCIQYTVEHNPNISKEGVKQQLIKHCHEKLFLLEEYMRTNTGKRLAKKRTDEMKEWMENFDENYLSL